MIIWRMTRSSSCYISCPQDDFADVSAALEAAVQKAGSAGNRPTPRTPTLADLAREGAEEVEVSTVWEEFQFGVSKFDKRKLKTVKTAEKIILPTAEDIKQAKKDETE